MMSYETEIDIPFDILDLDGYKYLVPHGLPLKAEPLLEAGIHEIALSNRNVTVNAAAAQRNPPPEFHPQLPVDEVLEISGAGELIAGFSNRLLEILGMSIEAISGFFSKSDERIAGVSADQLSISKGRLCIGCRPTEEMSIVWTGYGFVVSPSADKVGRNESRVCSIDGTVTGGKFRCKYGNMEIRR